ncbi:hypothetical protein [Streptomyces flavalbus]|uniref:Dynamin family protein n=1 Tax=Streptomyces flavalbus TaxID=2665155 RepID=A0ABW2W2T7_9ACTN
MATVDEIREDLLLLLSRSEDWLRELPDIPALAVDAGEIDEQVRHLRSQRGRALSSLLNVGLLGRQSSGKSFLISGLQKGLRYVRFEQQDGGFTEKYIGILPSSPTPTTVCPSTVTPVPADPDQPATGRGLLRVRFTDRPEAGWVEIGRDLPPGVIAAYGAADGDLANRLPEHYQRDVEQLELLIEDAVLPAKFFDLPGAESPNPAYENIMRKAWAEADCFLYVTQGTATLTANELGLVTDLYNHHLQTGKPVLWVLTGIDRANQLGNDNRPAWRSALETNNAYLRERFPESAGDGNAFIGNGFLAVSPAWEAQAALDEAEGSTRAAQRNRGNSRMDALRDQLTELINNGAGQNHLGRIAGEARRLVRRRHRAVADVLATHQVSVEELTSERAGLRQRLTDTEQSAERIRAELTEETNRRLRAAEQGFGDLAELFHRELDDVIDSGDLGLDHLADIRLRQTRLFTEWMNAPHGPATLWERDLTELDGRARALLRLELGGEESTSHLVEPAALDPGSLLTPLDDQHRLDFYGMVQATAAAVSVAGSVAGGAVWMMTSLSLASIAFPVGTVVAAGLTAAAGAKALKERKSVLERARDERRGQLDQQAEQARADFTRVAREQGQLLADAVAVHVDEHRQRLRGALQQIEERISAPDMASSRELVTRLEPVERAGRAVLDGLTDLEDLASGPTS